ncbi:MAG: hypothetical protein Q9218_006506, partial [Villophora microphyllina]
SLKSRVFNAKDLKSQPKQVYALVAEASKWSPILSEVITKSQLLQLERKLSPSLSLLLVHDLLLSKSGIAAPASHPLRVAATRHKARLDGELTKTRIKQGFRSIEDLRTHLTPSARRHASKESPGDATSSSKAGLWSHPRWIRMNPLKCSPKEQLKLLSAEYKIVKSLKQVLSAHANERALYVDEHVPDLLALTPGTDLVRLDGYRDGFFIVQDKASCFPAYLLDPRPEEGPCLDACAAPGNKTTHLAAILRGHDEKAGRPQVWACERDKARAETLKKMVHLAGCDDMVTVKAGQDFLQLDPGKPPWRAVGCLLLDPSCSGSGMIDREETITVTLPFDRSESQDSTQSRKRKRKIVTSVKTNSAGEVQSEAVEQESLQPNIDKGKLSGRLKALSAFQLRLLLHAFRFPNARKISYSTCSIHAEENENVVIAALESEEAREHGWRLLWRHEQVDGMKSWHRRGDSQAIHDALASDPLREHEITEACIRCEAGTEDGTQGFFVVAFIRELENRRGNGIVGNGHDETLSKGPKSETDALDTSIAESQGSEEWGGFSDSEAE